jgi:hypothetical protein
MDPSIDIERELAAAINADPAVNFTARVRARIAAEPPVSRSSWPLWVAPALTFALIAIAFANVPVWRGLPSMADQAAVFAYRDLVIVSPLPPGVSATVRGSARAATRRTVKPHTPAPRVLIAASEMHELQRLFSGAIVAPAVQEPVADELTIPVLIIDPIVPFPSNVEGDRQ